jgi:hypothetical protein
MKYAVRKTLAVGAIAILGIGASVAAQAQGTPLSAVPDGQRVQQEIDDRMSTQSDGSNGPVRFTLPAEDWQTSPYALMEVAEKYEISPDGHQLTAYFADATTVMVSDEPIVVPTETSRAPTYRSTGGCTWTQTAYTPSTPGVTTRATGSFSLSTGCSGSVRSHTQAQRKNCSFGCTWQSEENDNVRVYPSGNTTYVTVFACVNGTHRWRTGVGSEFVITQTSPEPELTNFC